MYQPPHFREDRLEIQHALIRAHPLGTLVTLTTAGLEANLVPFIVDAGGGGLGVLRCHVARANRMWRDFDPSVEALAVFQGPEAYITPSWYVTKTETGKVVPTWNYVVVQAYGKLVVRDDDDWLRTQVARLTDTNEAVREHPWAVADAPEAFVTAQIKGIVGIEMAITRIDGKWKVSQNRPVADRAGVVAGLEQAGGAATDMAALVARHVDRT